MTPNEIQMLCVGIALGAQLMSLLHLYWNHSDSRRNAARTQAAMKRAAGDRYLSSLRLYRLQHRSEA